MGFTPSPYDTLPYVPPVTWDDDALSERTTSLGFVEYATFDDVEPDWRQRVRASCFPPTAEEAKRFALHKCLRCLPQDMDTGGFFVALLKKVKPLSKNATEQMDTLAKESKGGEDVDAQLSTIGDEGTKKKSTSGSNEGEEVTISESTGTDKKKSATSSKEGEEVTITESSGADDKKNDQTCPKSTPRKGWSTAK